jgi:very-short-patch-repair endonuclease/DNA-directed RNA polymerase subunit RPC12/RpoP
MKCKNCGKEHNQEHNNDFCSKHCSLSYAGKLGAKKRSETFVPNYKYKCSICGEKFNRKLAFEQHEKSHSKKTYIWECRVCGEKFESRRAKSKHVLEEHGSLRGHLTSNYKIEGICQFCGYSSTTLSGLKVHEGSCQSNPNRIRRWNFGTHHTEEEKKIVSIGVTKDYEEGRHVIKSGWIGKGVKSYPEQWFCTVIENCFEDKDYKFNYQVGRYWLDFAWVEKHLYIEMDGEQHYRFKELIERDKKRDAWLKEQGWNVLRIPWTECLKDKEAWINKAKTFINNS